MKTPLKHRNYAIVGHRGFPEKFPENSLLGVLAAADLGIEGVEVDVQVSSDGVPMVTHDDNLLRTCGELGNVWDFSADELAVKSCHEEDRFAEKHKPCLMVRLSTLCDALAKKNFQGILFVELKRESLSVITREAFLNAVLKACAPILQKTVIISFDEALLQLAKGRVPIGWVLSAYDEAHRQQASVLSPDYLISDVKKIPEDDALWVGSWEWFVYDIVDPSRANRLAAQGVGYMESWNPPALMV